MQIKVQLVVSDDNSREETHTDVVVLEIACQRIEHLGLMLAESKQLLTMLQQQVLEQQATAFVQRRTYCPRPVARRSASRAAIRSPSEPSLAPSP
jgi:hypothetical protein